MTIPARRVLRLVEDTDAIVVDLVDAKKQLRVEHNEDDDLITGYLTAAQDKLEGPNGLLGRSLLNTEWAMDIPGFWPHEWSHEPMAIRWGLGPRYHHQFIDLPLAGVSDIGAITYYDASGDAQTLPPDAYQLVTDNRFVARVALKPDQCWPVTQCREDAVTISFTSGFGADKSDVPQGICVAIQLMVMDLYECEGDVPPDDYSPAILSLTARYRRRPL